jgi:hypothetical protein
MNKKIIEMVEEYEDEGLFSGPPTAEAIQKAEEALGLKFPSEYLEYVKAYGSGGIGGTEIEGVEGSGASVVQATERYRKFHLPPSAVVIMDSGEFFYCMDTAKNDGVVYYGDRSSAELTHRYDSFSDFVIDEFQESIDNL